MMKLILPAALFFLAAAAVNAQIPDTILFENFQSDPTPNWNLFPIGDDQTWVNFDEDGLTPYDQNDEHRAWYWSQSFYQAEDTLTGEVNYCAASLSYMENFAHGNRNWLITPPIHVETDHYTLHWKSAPFQLPRYMDGYLVLAAEGSNDLFSGVFSDTLFQAASMEDISGDGNSVHVQDFIFTPGYIHADSLRNDDYIDLWTPGDSTLLHAILEPHSVSLAPYAGKTIYLAFLHNSDDDYFFSIDDILVQNSTVSGAQDLRDADFRFVTYPNPVNSTMNVMYRLPQPASVSFQIHDLQGKLIMEQAAAARTAGEHEFNLQLAKLPAGSYTLTLKIGARVMSKVFEKK